MNNRMAGDSRITALYERLSRNDEKSKGRKAKLFFSASIRDAVFLLLDSPDKFVVDGNALFLTLAAASHTRRFVNRNPVNQFVKHEAVEFFKAGVFSDKGCEAVNIGFGMLADFLDMESSLIVSLHVQSLDQVKAIKTVKRKITDLDRAKIEEQKKAVRAGYDMDIIPSDLATYGNEAKKLFWLPAVEFFEMSERCNILPRFSMKFFGRYNISRTFGFYNSLIKFCY